jgi:hypothetical protein
MSAYEMVVDAHQYMWVHTPYGPCKKAALVFPASMLLAFADQFSSATENKNFQKRTHKSYFV